MHKAPMNSLKGGDVFFNRWPVPAIPWSHLLKLPSGNHDKLFADDRDRVPIHDEELDVETPSVDEEALFEADQLVPFPHELHMSLGAELLHVFGADVLVTTTVGSGEVLEAVLQ